MITHDNPAARPTRLEAGPAGLARPKAEPKRLVAPCIRDCPAGIDVPRYIGFIEKGMFAEAVAVVRERIPFPSVCGHVCYHPCEPKCRRASLEAPVAINSLKRAAVDRDTQLWREKWEATNYHQPSDELVPEWDLSGAVEDVQLYYGLTVALANAAQMPTWNPGDEFEAARKRTLDAPATPTH